MWVPTRQACKSGNQTGSGENDRMYGDPGQGKANKKMSDDIVGTATPRHQNSGTVFALGQGVMKHVA